MFSRKPWNRWVCSYTDKINVRNISHYKSILFAIISNSSALTNTSYIHNLDDNDDEYIPFQFVGMSLPVTNEKIAKILPVLKLTMDLNITLPLKTPFSVSMVDMNQSVLVSFELNY